MTTTETNERPVNWRKYFWLTLVLAVVAYPYVRPTIEKATGWELPVIGEELEAKNDPNADDSGSLPGEEAARRDSNADATNPIAKSNDPSNGRSKGSRSSTNPSQPKTTSGSKANSSTAKSAPNFELKDIGRNQFLSPAGLVYAMGPRGEHRVDHVMRHATDDKSRPVHGVFDGDRQKILSTIDEGYELVKSGSNRVKSSREGDRVEYTINMNRKIGFEGGQSGKRKRYPSLKKLKLILQDKKYVVTAYPYR